jgi:hypothetical protein
MQLIIFQAHDVAALFLAIVLQLAKGLPLQLIFFGQMLESGGPRR